MSAEYIILSNPARCYWAPTELEIAQREVSATTKRVLFTGGLRYNESKYLYREVELGIPDYAGFPTPEIDAAWEAIISTTDIFMTEKEVMENVVNGGAFADIPAGDRLYTDPYTGLYQNVPFVFHDLHCLNKIRRAIYIDHYPDEMTDIFWPHIRE
ncbi:hypothetical protein GQ53DRAFT_836057 [Thozetella sp. PMI_491]|nr:hypothetical protein GQ53DRAFT_836057 [Thozetella sp. PMI_491]